MCNACGYPARPGHWTDAGFADVPERLRGRFAQAALLRQVLGRYGLSVRFDGMSPGLRVSDRAGRHVLAADLDALWAAAEGLAGRAIDPLDPAATETADG